MAFGSGALEHNLAGDNNVASGGAADAQGTGNIAIGHDALRFNGDGSGNTAIGYAAGNRNRTGSNNVYIGSAGEERRIGDHPHRGPEHPHQDRAVGEVEGDINVCYQ